ncbi:dTDP-4-dehydrorhamnose reductase [Chitinispirillum alkaliphilum]|nr:dTDP-4-dehydrorhamnose reductase [Chitinispirillum alkaliphilum]
MKRVLLVGASGFLGQHICYLSLKSDKQIWGTFCTNTPFVKGVHYVKLDLCNPEHMELLISHVLPDTVVFCAAVSSPEVCEKDPGLTDWINRDAPLNTARICAKENIRFIFTSSDLVFDGSGAPYRETDPVSPVNAYGRQKAEAEKQILCACPDALVCRMPLMYGTFSESKNFTSAMIRAIKEKKTVSLFYDEYRTPISAISAADFLLNTPDHIKGILHLGGKQRISRYDFGVLTAKIFGLDRSFIKPVSQSEITTTARRPADVSLSSEKAYAIGFSPGLIEDELLKMAGKI